MISITSALLQHLGQQQHSCSPEYASSVQCSTFYAAALFQQLTDPKVTLEIQLVSTYLKDIL